MLETKELKKAILKEIKEMGIKRNLFTARIGGGSYSSSITFRFKNKVSKKIVEEIEEKVKKFEKYERDETTGEILSGGNTYIFIERERD